jgi:hypothetical protein
MNFWHFLSQPEWQGVGALIALVALVAGFRYRDKKRSEDSDAVIPPVGLPGEVLALNTTPTRRNQVQYFEMLDDESEQEFYDELAKRLRQAKESVYRLGRGFHHEHRSQYYEQIIEAEETALRRGVHITRIQMGSPVAAAWAERYAELLRRYPDNFHMRAFIDNTSLNDISVIDPHGHNPVVSLIFEAVEKVYLGWAGRPVAAIVISDDRHIARTLSGQLDKMVSNLPALTADSVSDLGRTYIYLGWGVHMAPRKMLSDVPDAELLGVAQLRRWNRDIKAIVSGPADRRSIRRTGNRADSFDGVAYELSWWGKARLDSLERRAYGEVPVEINLHGENVEAFTYVPLPKVTEDSRLSPDSWIYYVVEGAIENRMDSLLAELRSAGVRVEEFRRDIL